MDIVAPAHALESRLRGGRGPAEGQCALLKDDPGDGSECGSLRDLKGAIVGWVRYHEQRWVRSRERQAPVAKVSWRIRCIPSGLRYYTITACVLRLNQSCPRIVALNGAA